MHKKVYNATSTFQIFTNKKEKRTENEKKEKSWASAAAAGSSFYNYDWLLIGLMHFELLAIDWLKSRSKPAAAAKPFIGFGFPALV